jgi:hypothetical protein
MFSHKGVTAVTLSGRPSLQIPYNAPATVAAPPISPFINAMLFEGLMEIPPLKIYGHYGMRNREEE